MPDSSVRYRSLLIIACRVIVGITFIIAGWAKAIDPWGFIIKINEYLAVWKMNIPHELVVTGAIALCVCEFAIGLMILVGAFKRTAVIVAAIFMAFMLPLTIYIAVASPVSDCGCFGEWIVISNGATLAKNIVITAAIIYLLIYNKTIGGLFAVPFQWLLLVATVSYPLYLAFIGYNIQPLVDFRPFKTGTALFTEESDDFASNATYIYEKAGVEQEFTLDNLPDSTWTFVDTMSEGDSDDSKDVLELMDEEGANVTDELAETTGYSLYLVIPQPEVQMLSRARLINELALWCDSHGIGFNAILGVTGGSVDNWESLVRPHFPVYSAEETTLRMLVRGTSALVMTYKGIILWKRTLNSFDPSIIDSNKVESLAQIEPIDSGRDIVMATVAYMAALIIVYLIGLAPKILLNRKK